MSTYQLFLNLRGCPELECSKTASFCDFFLEGKERNEVIEFWDMVLYIFNEHKKIFVKVKKKNIIDFWAYFMGCSFQSAWKIHLVILDRNKKPKKDLIIIYFSSRWTKKVRQKVYLNNCYGTLKFIFSLNFWNLFWHLFWKLFWNF